MIGEGLYHGWVAHTRFAPKRHSFRYYLMMLYLDLDNEGKWPALRPWLGERRFSVAKFCADRHLSHRSESRLKQRVQSEVNALGGEGTLDKVFALCHPAYFGFHFSPINLYYCYRGEALVYILAEVSNTPWNERHRYLIDADNPSSAEKAFHVSPFMEMDQRYEWAIAEPTATLGFGVKNLQSDTVMFNANMQLKHQPLTRTNLKRIFLRIPLITFKIVFAIYWQALKIWLKGVPFIGHPSGKEVH
ncbi:MULTISPECIES: DUF1365 domain-containing protein [Corallincola]|uniref:DUF1365 domain-containing protein n=2 Tax=Corallincola TaxID=1775176 RepID=A0ABY1WTX1_9GAMM|nr:MULTISPECIES: DUF1365 domain-containing protein [Corallincola]TAA48180.1 DUF1365 domain-containing protein [Corallincola spongiicola]TCI02526.1 DUF1365 domain-containing protein [Corallincola luteus]